MTGLEPAMHSLKGCVLDRFAFILSVKIGTHGEIRTHNLLFLRQAPLPIWLRVRL